MRFRNFAVGVSVGLMAVCPDLAAELDAEKADAFVQQAMEEYGVPGAGIVVIAGGKTLLVRGYGVRDLSDPESTVDEDTLFQLASVSKTFTSAAVAVAVDKGKLRWDQPVVEIIPNLALSAEYPTRQVTAVDFLVHRAGFPAFFGDLFDHLGFSRAEVLERIREVVPAYSFRYHAEYSNIGFFLAGETAAAALGTTYESVVQQHIFDPLGMTRTAVSAKVFDAANAAKPHAIVDGKLRPVPNNLSALFVAAGGFSSSAKDLSYYLKMLLAKGKWEGKSVLSEQAVEALFQPWIASGESFAEFPPIGRGSGFAYTPGWGSFSFNNHQILEKGGALDGFRTILVLVPDQQLAVGVICNKNVTAFPEAVRAWVLEQVLGKADGADLQKEIAERAAQVSKIFASPPGPPENAATPSRDFAAFEGTYVSPLFGSWRVEINSGEDAETFPMVVFAGPAEYQGKIRRWDGDTLAVEWPIVLHFPSEMKFEFPDAKRPAKQFTFEGYTFTRSE